MPKLTGSGSAPAKIDINMTPMIDVVFQLLTFFLMTFKVATAEGDFALKLPRDGGDTGIIGESDRLLIRLIARPDGDLAAVQIDGLSLAGPTAFAQLHDRIVRLIHAAQSAGQPVPNVEIDADDALRYENVIQTVAAVSGRTNDLGEVEPLVRKIRFTPK